MSVCLSVSQSIYWCVILSVSLSVCLIHPYIHPSICLSVYVLSVNLSVSSIHPSVRLYVYLLFSHTVSVCQYNSVYYSLCFSLINLFIRLSTNKKVLPPLNTPIFNTWLPERFPVGNFDIGGAYVHSSHEYDYSDVIWRQHMFSPSLWNCGSGKPLHSQAGVVSVTLRN